MKYPSKMSRKTYIDIDGEAFSLEEYYNTIATKNISYRTYYQRVKGILKRQILLSRIVLHNAAIFEQKEWMSHYGGRQHNAFIYEGQLYPALFGKSFHSLAEFLRTVDKYHLYNRVKGRLQKNWPIDVALEHDPVDFLNPNGKIYCISTSCSEKKYVGLTITETSVRFSQHISRFKAQAREENHLSPLYQAFQDFGVETFSIAPIEEGIPIRELATREKYWIDRLNTVHPHGFNRLTGGQIGGGRRKETVYGGQDFPSVGARNALLSKQLDIPEHVIDQRLRRGDILPERSRRHSKHPDAGNSLWRQWKSLLNAIEKKKRPGEICIAWENIPDGYESFKKSVGERPSIQHKLYRIDETLPWEPGNVEWLSIKEGISRVHGKKNIFKETTYVTIKEIAEAHDIKRTTLTYRLKKGESLEKALSSPAGHTSPHPLEYNGMAFRSQAAFFRHIARQFGITPDQAKDRYKRNVPFDAPNQSISCMVMGIEFKSRAEAARHFGIPLGTVSKRLKSGWTLEEVFGLKARIKPD